MYRSRLLATACILGFAATASSVRAESAPARPQCAARIVPQFDSSIPANAPALVVLDESSSGLTSTVTSNAFSPATSAFTSRPDPRSNNTLYLPSGELPETSMATFRVNARCSQGPVFQAESRFTVVAAAPLPTKAGKVEVISGDKRGVHLGFRPSAELAPFVAVTMLEIGTKGKILPERTIPYGLFVDAKGRAESQFPLSRGSADTDFCAPNETSKKTIRLEVQAHVAGAATDPPPISVDVPIDCSEPPTASTPTPTVTDAGVDEPGATNASNVNATGCSATASGPLGGGPLALVGLGACVAALRRRKRRG